MPDDEKIENMDPLIKLWMFENWSADQNEKLELAKNHAYLLGSFWNPEAVKQLTGNDKNRHISSEEDLEKSMEMVQNNQLPTLVEKQVKRRKKIKLNR